jgi:predicted amidohydrolase YtcJ
MDLRRRDFMGGLAALPLLTGASPAPATVFRARRIVTMDPRMPVATHVAVADGRILGVARSAAALKPLLGGRAAALDTRFDKAVLLPGLIDPHVHPMQSAVMLNLPFVAPEDWMLPAVTYKGAQTPAAYRQRLAEELARSAANPFICWGHHELFHGPIDRQWLDEIAPDRAVVIWQRSFHEVILNSAAMRAWGFADRAPFDAAVAAAKVDPLHASFERGIFAETALLIALAKLGPQILSPAKIQAGLATMQAMMLRSGVTTISDMGTGLFSGFDAEAGMIKAAFERADNPSRVMLMPLASNVPAEASLDGWFADLSAGGSRCWPTGPSLPRT